MPPQLFFILMLEIIARLPPKALVKCKCVCKEWLTYMSTSDFLKTYSQHMRESLDQKILTTSRMPTCISRSLNYHDSDYLVSKNVTPPLGFQPKNLMFLSSLDGMLCVSLRNTWDLLVWNPVTGAAKMLSNSTKQGFFNARKDAVGFYVDATFDYNIIHIKRRRGTLAVFVYSLRRGSWKSTPFLKKRPYHGDTYWWCSGTFCGDAVYFPVKEYWLASNRRVIRFDVNTHQFSELPYPNVGGLGPNGSFVSIRSELHMYCSSGYYERPLELWKLYNGTWIKIFTYPYRVCLPLPTITSLTHYNLSGSTLVITEWGQVFEIDLRFNVAGFIHPTLFGGIIHGAIYTETILSPGF